MLACSVTRTRRIKDALFACIVLVSILCLTPTALQAHDKPLIHLERVAYLE